jgi:hypothetical protein
VTSNAITREQPNEAENVIKLNYDESDYHVIEFNVPAINQESKSLFSMSFHFFRQLMCYANEREQNCNIISISLTNENHIKAMITREAVY